MCVDQRRRRSFLALRKAYAKALWWNAWMGSVVGAERTRNNMEQIEESDFNLKGHQRAFKQRDVV